MSAYTEGNKLIFAYARLVGINFIGKATLLKQNKNHLEVLITEDVSHVKGLPYKISGAELYYIKGNQLICRYHGVETVKITNNLFKSVSKINSVFTNEDTLINVE